MPSDPDDTLSKHFDWTSSARSIFVRSWLSTRPKSTSHSFSWEGISIQVLLDSGFRISAVIPYMERLVTSFVKRKWFYSRREIIYVLTPFPFRSRMEELRMFLENEAWQLCPVKASFKIMDLQVGQCCKTLRSWPWKANIPVLEYWFIV